MNSVQATFLGFIVPVIGMAAVPGTAVVWREWFPDALLRQFGSGK